MITWIDGNRESVNGKEWYSKGLTELKIPKNLKQGKGQELIAIMEAYLRGRAKQYGYIIPELLRIGRDLDAQAGTYYKPPTIQDGYSQINDAYREQYREQSKELWCELLVLLGTDLKMDVTKLFQYGLYNQCECACQEYDGVTAYFALLQQNRPQGVEHREEITRTFERAAAEFAKGAPLAKIEYLEPKLKEAEMLGVKLRWSTTRQQIALVMTRLDNSYTSCTLWLP